MANSCEHIRIMTNDVDGGELELILTGHREGVTWLEATDLIEVQRK